MPVTLYLVRHGECLGSSPNSKKGLCLSTPTSALTEKGKIQAKLLGEYLKNENFMGVYSSNSARAFETTQIILSQSETTRSLPIVQDRRLQEQNWGRYRGRPLKETLRSLTNMKSTADFLQWRPEGGESGFECTERVGSFFKDLINFLDKNKIDFGEEEEEDPAILIVSHASLLLHLFNHLLSSPAEYSVTNWKPQYNRTLGNGCFFKVRINNLNEYQSPVRSKDFDRNFHTIVDKNTKRRRIEILKGHFKEHLWIIAYDLIQKVAAQEPHESIYGYECGPQ